MVFLVYNTAQQKSIFCTYKNGVYSVRAGCVIESFFIPYFPMRYGEEESAGKLNSFSLTGLKNDVLYIAYSLHNQQKQNIKITIGDE